MNSYDLGNYYLYEEENFDEAIKCFEKSIQSQDGGYKELAEIYLNIKQENVDLGLYYLNRAMLIEGIDAYYVALRYYKRIGNQEMVDELEETIKKYA